MTLQDQTRLSDKEKGTKGNCLVSCYACYMDLPIEECPQFQFLFDVKHFEGFWDSVVNLWLSQMGYEREFYEEDPFIIKRTSDYYFACGISPRGFMHQVIYKDGVLFHDPHPSKKGLTNISNFEVIKKIEKHWRWL